MDGNACMTDPFIFNSVGEVQLEGGINFLRETFVLHMQSDTGADLSVGTRTFIFLREVRTHNSHTDIVAHAEFSVQCKILFIPFIG